MSPKLQWCRPVAMAVVGMFILVALSVPTAAISSPQVTDLCIAFKATGLEPGDWWFINITPVLSVVLNSTSATQTMCVPSTLPAAQYTYIVQAESKYTISPRNGSFTTPSTQFLYYSFTALTGLMVAPASSIARPLQAVSPTITPTCSSACSNAPWTVTERASPAWAGTTVLFPCSACNSMGGQFFASPSAAGNVDTTFTASLNGLSFSTTMTVTVQGYPLVGCPASSPGHTSGCEYFLQFNETGLPATSPMWGVSVGGTLSQSGGVHVDAIITNGTYPWVVAPPAGFTASPASGTTTIAGASIDPVITFAPIVTTPGQYVVTFTERGLPQGTSWSMTFGGKTLTSMAPASIQFIAVNGTYSYTVGAVSGYSASPTGGGSVAVSGAPMTVSIVFTASPSGGGGVVNGGSTLPFGLPVIDWTLIVLILVALFGLVYFLAEGRPKKLTGKELLEKIW